MLWGLDILSAVATRTWVPCLLGNCRSVDYFNRQTRLEAGGFLETKRAPNLDRLRRLTEFGRIAALGGRDPIVCWDVVWDEQWSNIIYDVPITHRTLRLAVQRRFKQLHFGRLQGSAWISPHPLGSLRDILRGIDIDPASFFTLRGRPETGESDAQIVERAWNFTAIARDYDRYFDHIRNGNRPVSIREDKRWREREHELWRRATAGDPFLPRVLWPKNYRGEQALHARADLFASI